MPYVSVEHEPGVWVDAHVEKQWKHEGRWRLSVYYFVGVVQCYRVFDADQVRPAGSPVESNARLAVNIVSPIATAKLPGNSLG